LIFGWRVGGPDASGPFDRLRTGTGPFDRLRTGMGGASARAGRAPPLRVYALRVYGRAGGGEIEGGSGARGAECGCGRGEMRGAGRGVVRSDGVTDGGWAAMERGRRVFLLVVTMTACTCLGWWCIIQAETA